jgi:GT2 family glycosyltransferase
MRNKMTYSAPEFSVILLTYNREKYLALQLPELIKLNNAEIIIVDNASSSDYAEALSAQYENTQCIKLDKNYGAVGRNFGIQAGKGKYLITLDDDVWGITNDNLIEIKETFEKDSAISAICFKVLDEKDRTITNWCHHNDPAKLSESTFDTYEISEGAAAFKREIFSEVGLYPFEFFISHEGPDLAFRIINSGKRIIYTPKIEVTHAHAVEGRKNWRRYYYDTRNLIWLAYRNYNWDMLLTKLPLSLTAMLLYSIRDGFVRYYLKAIKDALFGIKDLRGTRQPMSNATRKKMKSMDINKPNLAFYIKKRLFAKGVKI